MNYIDIMNQYIKIFVILLIKMSISPDSTVPICYTECFIVFGMVLVWFTITASITVVSNNSRQLLSVNTC